MPEVYLGLDVAVGHQSGCELPNEAFPFLRLVAVPVGVGVRPGDG